MNKNIAIISVALALIVGVFAFSFVGDITGRSTVEVAGVNDNIFGIIDRFNCLGDRFYPNMGN